MPEAYTAEVDNPEAPYVAELDLQVGASGDLECRTVTVSQRPGGPPVTARGLRSLPLGQLVQAAAAAGALSVAPGSNGSVVMTPLLGRSAEVDGAYELSRARAREGGRGALTDEHYRKVAAVYTRAERHPTKAVHLHKAWAPISYSTAARWVGEARRRGYLPPPAPA
jgi:hypothetical protein